MKTTVKNNVESIIDYLNDLSDSELVNIHNEYCRENCPDDEIFTNDEEFFNTYFEGKMMEAIRAISYGEYNYANSYVVFNGYANLESFDFAGDRIDINAIANDILENPESYYDIELEEEEEIGED